MAEGHQTVNLAHNETQKVRIFPLPLDNAVQIDYIIRV